MKVKKSYLTILIVLILTLFFSCAKKQTGENDDGVVYVYQVPAIAGDGWVTASLQDVGMNPGPITNLMEELLNRNDHLYHSLLIIKDGMLVLEEYFDGFDMEIFEGLELEFKEFDRDTLHYQASTIESIPLPSSMVEPYHSYGYGYQWWLERYNSGALDAYSGRGWGGQYIVVLPGVDLVVVFTSGAYEVGTANVPLLYYDIIQNYILPSLN